MTSSPFCNQKRKQVIISLSSDDDEEEEVVEVSEESEAELDEEQGSEEEDDDEDVDSDDPSSEDGSGSTTDYDEEDEEEDDDDDDDDDDKPEGKLTEEAIYNKVVDLLRRRRSLNTLKLEECKAYLRKHQLRINGTKTTCIERILDHWRIKDTNAEKLYPTASFVINCTGDVCKGDVILFKQRVYEKFDKVKRGGGGNIIGKRIIAGRVVKESYGAEKQQHTFTVEILWSKGVKPLPLLFPLLIKGRNLYRHKTFRQRWSNETERSKVLAEKHKRGAAARHKRAMVKARSSITGSKRDRKSSSRAPSKRPRTTAPEPSTINKKPTRPRKKGPQPSTRKKKPTNPHTKVSPTVCAKSKPVPQPRHLEPSGSHPRHNSNHENAIHALPPFPRMIRPNNHYNTASHAGSRMVHGYNHHMSYSSAPIGALHHGILPRGNHMHHPYPQPTPPFDPRYSSHFSRQVHFNSGPPPGEEFLRWRWP